MPAVDQRKQPQTGGGGASYEETPAQRRGWRNVRQYIEDYQPRVLVDDTFKIKGIIKKIMLDGGDDNPKYFVKDVNRDGEKKQWSYVKVVALITEPDVVVNGAPLELPIKDVGANFFDGRSRDGTRGTARGGMYTVHLAVNHEEPSKDLIDGRGSWDTSDYEGKPVLLVVKYAGDTEDDRYADRRDGMALWLQGFERDPEARPNERKHIRPSRPHDEDNFDDDPQLPARGGSGPTSGRSTTTRRRGDDDSGAGGSDDNDPPSRASGAGDEAPRASNGKAASARRATSTDDDTDELPAPTRATRGAATASATAPATAASSATTSVDNPALQLSTERQQKFIGAIAREAGLDQMELDTWVDELYGCTVAELNRRDASALIEALQRRRNEVA
jgi:hypothetical protein